ncbi:MAG: peptide chain release factor 2 [Candidatus Tectimicrobiota bacterium]|nr:MAG: peptide chain release factor 2 [Candidatus Tectomicrobia bacterium]
MTRCEGIFELARKQEALAALEAQMAKSDFWTDVDKAQEVMKRRAQLQAPVERWQALAQRLQEATLWLALAEEEQDPEVLREVAGDLQRLEAELERFELETLMHGELDANNALLSIHPGAGGTESQDWAQMLMRMYLRWAETHGYRAEVLDVQPAEEAGIKSATLRIAGPYAYGYLKGETGVHRLVRISPFDAARRRHTSFAAVLVTPELDDTVEVEIDESRLRVDTYRSSGAGGQHVNVTDSAVRLTYEVDEHTKIVVQCQNERSQHKNRAIAMSILRSRLYALQQQRQREKLAALQGEKKEIAWGNQIRSYVLAPYQLVKDHRTGVEVGNVEAVFDGGLDPFIHAYLLAQREARETSRS